MPKNVDKIQLLREMALNAMELESSIKECEWRSARAYHTILLEQIKEFERILRAEPTPLGYAEKCACLNCSANSLSFATRSGS